MEIGQFTRDDGDTPGWIQTAVCGGPWLIKEGKISTFDICNCTNLSRNSCTSQVTQTAAGLSPDNEKLFIVYMVGGDASYIAEFRHARLNIFQAIQFDGGGSSQLYFAGLPGENVDNKKFYRGDGRWLSQYLVIGAPKILTSPSNNTGNCNDEANILYAFIAVIKE